MSLVFSYPLCYSPDIVKDTFNVGFHTDWVVVIIHGFDLGWGSYRAELQMNNNYCTRSMHRHDLHEEMFWSERWMSIQSPTRHGFSDHCSGSTSPRLSTVESSTFEDEDNDS